MQGQPSDTSSDVVILGAHREAIEALAWEVLTRAAMTRIRDIGSPISSFMAGSPTACEPPVRPGSSRSRKSW